MSTFDEGAHPLTLMSSGDISRDLDARGVDAGDLSSGYRSVGQRDAAY